MGMDGQTLQVVLSSVRELNANIKEFRLQAADGSLLPGYTAGAHIKVAINGGASEDDWRAYSLVNLDPSVDTTAGQHEYVIAVQYESQGRGGSRFMHEQLKAGDRLAIQAPVNHFPLDTSEEAVVLIGGGIGVTPIISMASALKRAGRGFIFHYAVRSAELAVYSSELQQSFASELRLHQDDQPATQLELETLLQHCNGKQPIYICGPAGMITALRGLAEACGRAPETVHFELFGSASASVEAAAGDAGSFEVELRSGQVLQVPAGSSLLEVLQNAGVEVMADCRDGYCGLCSIPVLEGEIEHHDSFLSNAQRDSGRIIQACVSRGVGRLKLDI